MEQPIFIVGCGRSGTTLLRLMLNQSPVLHIPRETVFLPELRKQEELYGDFSKPYQRWFFIRDLQTYKATSKSFSFPVFELTLEEAEAALAETAPTDYPGATASLFQAAARKKGKQYWGDKTPRYVLEVPWLSEAFPDAKFVHIIRDGRDVAASMIKAGWVNSFLKAGCYWQTRVKFGTEAGSVLGTHRYYEIRYEQLVIYPEKTLKDLCSWLNLEYTPMMLQFYEEASDYVISWKGNTLIKTPINPSRVCAWKTELSQGQIADFESVAGELLEELGYEVTGAKVPFYLRTTRSLMEKLKSNLKSNAPGIWRQLGLN